MIEVGTRKKSNVIKIECLVNIIFECYLMKHCSGFCHPPPQGNRARRRKLTSHNLKIERHRSQFLHWGRVWFYGCTVDLPSLIDKPYPADFLEWLLVFNYIQESNNRSIMFLDLLRRTRATRLDSLIEITNKWVFSIKNYEIRGYYS